jgi:hypothetical protein
MLRAVWLQALIEFVSIGLPFLQLTRTRHPRIMIGTILLLTLVCSVGCSLLTSSAGCSDLLLLRSYTFSASFYAFLDEQFSGRFEETPQGVGFFLFLIILNGFNLPLLFSPLIVRVC